MKKYLPLFTSLFPFLFLRKRSDFGIINRYTSITALDTCSGKLSVSDTSGFRVGGAVLLIQMQGAEIMTSNNASYGSITAMNAAGFYERAAVIDSVAANAIFVQKRLVHAFNPAGKLQLVSIPQYSSVIVSDTLRAKTWDGTTGGLLALEVTNTLTLNAPILANGTGFRGGANYVASGNTCNWITPVNGYVYALGNWRGGYKGEGIAVSSPGFELGRGPQSNGGGGGNDHNSGGGGGSNISNGGDGGNNADPNPIGCNGYFPGIGGYAPGSTANRIFLGGGGGAGHANNLLKSKGGNGGGIVLIKAGAINGSAPAIYAKGGDAGNSYDDGAGGGGAGGSIWLNLGTPNPNLVLNANGGRGGSADNGNVDRCMGPGGGGAGGRILTNAPAGIFTVTGGIAGITFNSTVGCNNTNNNAEAGNLGEILPLTNLAEGASDQFQPQILAQPLSLSACIGKNAVFTVEANAGDWIFQWQVNAGSGWQDIQAGSSYSGFLSDELTLQNLTLAHEGLMFRCKVMRPGCTEVISEAVVLHILPLPTAGFTLSMNGTTATFNNTSTNATAYFWTFGDGSNSSLANPVHTYTSEGSFIATLLAWNSCDTVMMQQTVNVFLPPTAGFSVPATVFGCGSAQVNFQNQSSANTVSYNWSFPGGTPGSATNQNPTISYTVSGIYTAQLIVTNTVGKDTLEKTFEVEISDLPNAGFSWQAFSGGLVQFTNLSQNGETYTWDFGDGSPQQNGFNIQHDYAASGSYVVTLIVSSSCGVSLIQQDVMIQVVGTSDIQQLAGIRLFPNPVGDWLTLDWGKTGTQPLEIQVFDAAGNSVFQLNKLDGQSLEISLEGFAAGVYQVLVLFDQGVISRAVVKGL